MLNHEIHEINKITLKEYFILKSVFVLFVLFVVKIFNIRSSDGQKDTIL